MENFWSTAVIRKRFSTRGQWTGTTDNGTKELGKAPSSLLASFLRRLSRIERDVRTGVVDPVVLRVGAGEVGARVVHDVVRAAEAGRELLFRAGGNHDAQAAFLVELRAVKPVGAVADRDLRAADVVEDLRVGPRVGQAAIRNRRGTPRHRVGRNRHLQDAGA